MIPLFRSLIVLVLAALTVHFPSSVHATPTMRGMHVLSSASASDVRDLETVLNPKQIRYTLSMGPLANTASKSQYMFWLNKTLNHFDTNILPILKENGTRVVLSLGTPPGGFIVKTQPAQMRIFTADWAQQAIKEVWLLLANRYKNEDAIAAYYLLGEPSDGLYLGPGLLDWYQLQIELAKLIRGVDKTRPIILTSEFSVPGRLKKIPRISNLGTLWYGVHVYYPLNFIQQGVERPPYRTNYPTKKFGKKKLQRYLAPAAAFARVRKAKLYVAEFTTSRFGPAGSDVRFLRDLVSLFNRYRWHWSYHAWREAEAWTVEKPALQDTRNGTTARARLLRRYFQ